LAHGADKTLTGRYDKTAYNYAEAAGFTGEILDLLMLKIETGKPVAEKETAPSPKKKRPRIKPFDPTIEEKTAPPKKRPIAFTPFDPDLD